MAQATVLRPGQYRHLLRVTAAISRDPERDTLVLLLGIIQIAGQTPCTQSNLARTST